MFRLIFQLVSHVLNHPCHGGPLQHAIWEDGAQPHQTFHGHGASHQAHGTLHAMQPRLTTMTWVLWICSHKLLLTTSLVQSNCLGCHQQLNSGANVRVGIVTACCTAVGNVLPGRHKFPNLLQIDNRVHTLSNNKITSHIVFYLSNHKVLFYHQGNW